MQMPNLIGKFTFAYCICNGSDDNWMQKNKTIKNNLRGPGFIISLDLIRFKVFRKWIGGGKTSIFCPSHILFMFFFMMKIKTKE